MTAAAVWQSAQSRGPGGIATDSGKLPFGKPPFRAAPETGDVDRLPHLQTPGTGSPNGHRTHLASRVSAISKDAFDDRERRRALRIN